MKVLFVYQKFVQKATGGIMFSRRNYQALSRIFGEENVITYPIERKRGKYSFVKVLNQFIELGLGGLTRSDKEKVLKIVDEENIDYVHLDSSIYGSLAKFIRMHNKDVKIVVYFQNVEYDFLKSICWHTSLEGLLMGYMLPLVKLSEKYSLTYSNTIISLHKKDSERLKELYGKSANYEIPITLNDDNIKREKEKLYGEKLRLLFFGSRFKPNIEAVKILVKKILPQVMKSVELLIAGDGMNTLADEYSNYDNVTIKGFVEDINDIYAWADLVILPIYSGAGMKVKTAEALLYGKNMLASDMALEGYDVDNVPGILRCHTIDDFVKGINTWDKSLPRTNLLARALYEDKYSYDASFKMFKKVYDSL